MPMENPQGLLLNTPGNKPFAELGNIIMHLHFDLTCAKVEEVNKRFAGLDKMQSLYLYTSFICTVPGIYSKNSC